MKQTNAIAVRMTSIVFEYVKLMKPELTLLSVMTAVASSYVALQGSPSGFTLIHTFIGTTLVGGAAGVLNQFIERKYDALMKRTEQRPLPAGRIQPIEAGIFCIVLAGSGISYLAITTNLISSVLAMVTLISYLFLYTPLKRRTPFAPIIGGIPGALPPLIGWSVVRESISLQAMSLFFILYFWQMPHFLSLAWMYRKDYKHAGYKTIAILDPSGSTISRQITIYSLALLPASLLPALVGLAGVLYFCGALVLSSGFLIAVSRSLLIDIPINARRIFSLSLYYLPALYVLLLAFS